MDDWLVFAVLALIFWGLWGFFPKLATKYISPQSIWVYGTLGSIAVVGIFLLLIGFRPEIQTQGIIIGILTGIAGAFGTLFFFYGVSRGKSSVVVTMTALYPLVTILLASIVLKEPITIRQGIGMLLALTAITLMSV